MKSTFDLFSITTVPSSYSWDDGIPGVESSSYISDLRRLSALNSFGEVEYVCYAPLVTVALSSAPGIVSLSSVALRRTVDFGDYYNSLSNTVVVPSLSNEVICHNYIMPGTYSISYNRTDYFLTSGFDSTNVYIQTLFRERSPLAWQWYNFLCYAPSNEKNLPICWSKAVFQGPNQYTWSELAGPCYDSNEKFTSWKWNNTICNVSANPLTTPVTWDETGCSNFSSKTWDQISEVCEEKPSTLEYETEQAVKSSLIRVVEIPSTAYLEVTQPCNIADRVTPLTVTLTPRYTRCGSFPIEKIIWDLGDGSPLLVQKRWANNVEPPFIYTDAYNLDYQDPRNYDIIHTYYRTSKETSVFYPSLTAYASSTGTTDCAKAVVGPIQLSNLDTSKIKILHNELSETNNTLILGTVENNLALWQTKSSK